MKNILLMREAWDILGGTEEQVLAFAEEFVRKKLFRPILVTGSENSCLFKKFKERGFDAYIIPMRRRDGGSINSAYKKLKLLVQENDIVAIQAHSERESFIARRIKKTFPNIINIFRIHTYIATAHIPEWKKFIYHQYDRFTSKYVDRYICISKITAEEAAESSKIDKNKICVVTDLCKQLGPPDAIEEKEGCLPAKLAMVANINPGKGHDVIIESIGLLNKKGIGVQARFIGGEFEHRNWTSEHGCSYADSLREKAKSLGISKSIQWYGYTRDIRKATKGFPIVVLPSDSEGIPNCILEAMSFAKLVIASNVGGIPEIIEHMKTGLLHSPGNPQALAEIIETVVTSPQIEWNNIRKSAYKCWYEKFSKDVTFGKMLSIYREFGIC